MRDSPPIRDKTMLQKLIAESTPAAAETPRYMTPQQYQLNLSSAPFPQSPSTPQSQSAAMAAAAAAAVANIATMPVSNAGKFQPASASKLNSSSAPGGAGASAAAGKKDRVEGGFVVKDAANVLAFLGIEGEIDSWSEKMRWWISGKVFKPLVERCDKVDEQLKVIGWNETLGCGVAAWSGGILNPVGSVVNGTGAGVNTGGFTGFGASIGDNNLFGPKLGTSSLFGQSTLQTTNAFCGNSRATPLQNLASVPRPVSLWEMQQQYGNHPLCQERLKVEQYLNIPEYSSCRPYIMERIQALSKSGGLASFKWDSSSSSSANPFSPSLSSAAKIFGASAYSSFKATDSINPASNFSAKLTGSNKGEDAIKVPSDSEIIVHLVRKFFDEQMGGSGAFSSKYFTILHQFRLFKKADHHRIIISCIEEEFLKYIRYGKFFPICAYERLLTENTKRNNVFQMLSVFAYIVSVTAGGYVGLLNLGGNSFGMITSTEIASGSPGASQFLQEEEDRRRKMRAAGHNSDGENEASKKLA
ncbi:hypothetical protein HK100_002385 [Physocladia obscura]|uniref:Uncharacterized protein n=1 Tax=Physocladia obscura TaxID=109957 RepID=A0AAD5SXL2_9FUNG|nr:hypothetical protein HK100_002385 [Physocladia obscura]